MLVALLAMLAQAPATTPPAAPVSAQRYRITASILNELDQSAIGKGVIRNGLTTRAVVTVSMSDTTVGQIANIKIDSISLEPVGTIADQLASRPNAAHDAVGSVIRALIVQGKLVGVPRMSDSTNPALIQVAQAASVLFPGVRRNVKMGDKWADTSNVNHEAGGRKQTGRVVADWSFSGVDNSGAMILDGVATTSTRTDDVASGQAMVLDGRTKEHMVVPASGPVHGATIETANDTKITAPQLPAPIPGKSTGTLKVELIG